MVMLLSSGKVYASEAELILPDLRSVKFLWETVDGWSLLVGGLVLCVLGAVFGMVQFSQIKKMKVHKSMLDISGQPNQSNPPGPPHPLKRGNRSRAGDRGLSARCAAPPGCAAAGPQP